MTPLTLGIAGFVIGLLSGGLALTGYYIGLKHGMDIGVDECAKLIHKSCAQECEEEDLLEDAGDFEHDDKMAEEVKNYK